MTTTETKTLLEFLLDLLRDDDARAAFQANPEQALHDAGLQDVSVEDIKELLPVVLEHCHPSKAAHYEQHCDDDHEDSHPSHHDDSCDPQCDDDHGHQDDGHHGHGPYGSDSELDKVITHLNYVTNNYYVDSHDTIFNTDINNNVWNYGDGDVDLKQTFDFHPNVASGDHAVLVDGDNNGAIAAGDGSSAVNGDGNAVSGAGSTTSFGSGTANSGDVDADHGAAVSFGSGSASGYEANSYVDSHADNSNQGNTDNSVHDSGNTDNSLHDSNNPDNSVHDSGNTDNSDQDNSSHLKFEDNSDHSTDNSIDAEHASVQTHDPAFAF